MCNKDIQLFTKVLKTLEERSTCARIQVAAIATKNGRIISTGWNGVASGKPHCKHHFANHTTQQMLDQHRAFSLEHELHAERNCIDFATENNISLEGTEMYVSYSPCKRCSRLIIDAGVYKVYFTNVYDREPEGITNLKNAGIDAYHIVDTETIIQQ